MHVRQLQRAVEVEWWYVWMGDMQGRLQLQRAVDVEWQYVWVGEFWDAALALDRWGSD